MQQNAFSELAQKVEPIAFNFFSMLVVDLMHEFELGVFKAVFVRTVRRDCGGPEEGWGYERQNVGKRRRCQGNGRRTKGRRICRLTRPGAEEGRSTEGASPTGWTRARRRVGDGAEILGGANTRRGKSAEVGRRS